MAKKSPLETVRSEFEKAEKLFTLLLIMKDSRVIGKILGRWSSTGVAYISLHMYITDTGNEPMLAYERMGGYGYPKFACGLEAILKANKELLAERYGIVFENEHNIMNNWRNDFKACGYQVVYAIG